MITYCRPGKEKNARNRIIQDDEAFRKDELLLPLLRSEDLELLSRKLGVIAARLSQWRQQFLKSAGAAIKNHPPDAQDLGIARLQQKGEEMTMENELLRKKIQRKICSQAISGHYL